MTYVYTTDNVDDNSGVRSNVHLRTHATRGNVPAPYFSFEFTAITNRLLCTICSMGKMAKAQVFQLTSINHRIEKLREEPSILWSACMKIAI